MNCFESIKPLLSKLDSHINDLFKNCSEIVDQYNNNTKLLCEENYQVSDVLEIRDLNKKINKYAFKFLKKTYLEKKGEQFGLKVITSFLSFVFIVGRISLRVCRIYEFLEDLKVSYFLQIANF